MKNIYNEEILIKYIYNELSANDTKGFEKEMNTNPNLKSDYKSLISLITKMELFVENPNPNTVENIISYSKSIKNKDMAID
ncbi:MAG: hypothetical protein U9R42_15365 [Bacteroidota bacterium]|nr:hypothetical protein [Bacteroidota bacterium]